MWVQGLPPGAREKQAPCPSRLHRAKPGVAAAKGHKMARAASQSRQGDTGQPPRQEADCKAKMQKTTWDPRVKAPQLQEACRAAAKAGET